MLSLTISSKLHDIASEALTKEVFPIMTKDSIFEVTQNDNLIMATGGKKS